LVRVIDASPAHEAFLARMPGSRWVRGRRADERVTSLRPRLPTLPMTTKLLIRLLEQATDVAPRVSRIAEGRKGFRKIVGQPGAGLEGRHGGVAMVADEAGVQRVAS